MSKVTPFLMFNDQLESAIEFYTSTFPDSRVTNVARAERGGAFPRWPDPFARLFAVRSEHHRGDVLAPCPHSDLTRLAALVTSAPIRAGQAR